MDLEEPFAAKFNAAHLTVFKTEHWSVLVRQPQATIGSLVLAANRCFISASEMTENEAAEFPKVVGQLEAALSKVFRFDKINYLCLMMVDRHFHFHVLPRYEGVRHFAGQEWSDSGWPKPPVLAAPNTDDAVLIAVRDALRQDS